jgi:hypothetical protein
MTLGMARLTWHLIGVPLVGFGILFMALGLARDDDPTASAAVPNPSASRTSRVRLTGWPATGQGCRPLRRRQRRGRRRRP